VPLVAGLFVASISIFALTLTTSPFIVVNLVVIAGLAYAISIPAWAAAALDATDAGARGLWLGTLTAVQGLGVAGGQALGGVIGGIWGPLAPFKLAALLLMVALTLIISHQAVQRAAPLWRRASAAMHLIPAAVRSWRRRTCRSHRRPVAPGAHRRSVGLAICMLGLWLSVRGRRPRGRRVADL
jgi:MFS family permease